MARGSMGTGLAGVGHASYGVHEEQAGDGGRCVVHHEEIPYDLAICWRTLRLHLWRNWWKTGTPEERKDLLDWLFHYISTTTG